ncbi:sugar dehydrogenase complex small subunit [Robbsia sp. Bb-Pol-6]|uniref:Sugar dehydrogenase complex small subunit n=1 Tax=Robbsia betulipollinis TaxID=2981849 RepID=A0ABT3ZHR0_9BURK|nr:sugar dehydrogenase complex small subunit [Robbsia betulipollinis]MCY0386065.1 sugar dehydrogenase complex small subunit [Robbsia betulipollinis]
MIDYSRRRLLGYGAMVVTASFGGKLLTGRARAATAMPRSADLAPTPRFLALSRLLTGYAEPDAGLARRLYAALHDDFPLLDTQLDQLAALLARAPSGPFVPTGQPQLATLYQQLLGGWYLGVLGPKSAPRCIAFENTVSYRVVQRTLTPPSYCVGEPTFWAYKPA